jgi:type I restriction enzyme S subunit
MNKYPKYKPSNIQWIGDIPDHWNFLQIKRLTNVKRGASPRPIDDPKYFDDNGEFSWVRISDVTASERYLSNTTQTLSELGASLSVKRYPGDLFLSIAGTVGKPIITKIKCCIHDGFVWFPNLKINTEYLYYIFSTGLPYQGLGKWGTQLNLNTETVGDIYIPLPDENEIESLVNFLDKKIAQLATLIANKQKLIDFLEEERMAIINEAISGKGKNWERKKISHGFKKIGSGTTPASGNEDYYNGTINWLQTGDLNDGEINTTSKKITKKALEDYSTLREFPKGSLVIAMYGATIGKVGILNIATTTNQACCVLSEPINFDINFVFWWFVGNKKFVVSKSYGGGQPNISQELIKSLRLPCPSIKEQTVIVKQILNDTNRIDNTISKIEKEIDLLQEYKVALISEVVTGKVKVT